MPTWSSTGSFIELSREMIGRSCRPSPRPCANCRPNASISLPKPNSSAFGSSAATSSVPTPARIPSMPRSIHSRACSYAARCGAVDAADRERAVVAGPVAVVGVDDVEEGLVAGPDQPVGEVVRVRVAPLPRDRVDRLDLVRAHLVEPLVGERHDLVLADARLERLDDVLVDPVHHRHGLGQQHDLVARLDHPSVEHELLGVDDGQSLPLHLEEERRLDDVDADRQVGHAGLDQQRLDLGDGGLHQPDRRAPRRRGSRGTRPGSSPPAPTASRACGA